MEAVNGSRTFDVLVTGSRYWPYPGIVQAALQGLRVSHPDCLMNVIHGACAHGADALADDYARRQHWNVEPYPANWAACGKAAGHIRNERMRDRLLTSQNDLTCVAFCYNWSRGTMDMLTMVRDAGLPWNFYNASDDAPGRVTFNDSEGNRRDMVGTYPPART